MTPNPGDVLEVRILDVRPRGSANPQFAGRAFGSNAAAWWGFHFGSARGDRRVATPPEFVYRHNSLVGHALV
jgi:hypothetical protein